jgi:hypothetical protein
LDVRRAVALFFFAAQLYGQRLEIGIKGADRPTGQLEGYGNPESRPYLVGPMVQLNLPRRFAVEADALYSRFGYSYSTSDLVGDFYSSRDRANSWQLPVLLKYRLHVAALHLYVLAGWDPEHSWGTTKVYASLISNPYDPNATRTLTSYSLTDRYGTNHGLVAGGGIDFGSRHWRVRPEVRYIRWKDPTFSIQQSHGFYLQVPQNEVQLMLGVAFCCTRP